MTREEVGLILEALGEQRLLLDRIANALESAYWTCGCGHVNGSNLATCAVCGRSPGERQ